MIAQTLSQIASQQSLLLWTTCVALLLFVSFFTGMLIWTSRSQNKTLYKFMSQMPLEDSRSENVDK